MLTRDFIKTLAQKAQQLPVVIIIGAKGLTEAVQAEINQALMAHELIKIRLNASTREARVQMIQSIADEQQAHLISKIGHIAVFYRRNED